jgi:DNA-binding response OmpR family regulator
MTSPPSDQPRGGPADQEQRGGAGHDSQRLEGLRVLVAEDEFLVALLLEEELNSLGCLILGPYTTVSRATRASNVEDFDLAILDINLAGELVYPLADDFTTRGVPFLFLSGYGSADIPERFRSTVRVAKPYEPSALAAAITALLPRVR